MVGLQAHSTDNKSAARRIGRSYRTRVKAAGVQKAFLAAPELHPALDSGIFAAWIAAGRSGRILVGGLNAVFRRAVAEAESADRAEPTPYLVLLSLRRLAAQIPALVR